MGGICFKFQPIDFYLDATVDPLLAGWLLIDQDCMSTLYKRDQCPEEGYKKTSRCSDLYNN
jgi:hypothetical protein